MAIDTRLDDGDLRFLIGAVAISYQAGAIKDQATADRAKKCSQVLTEALEGRQATQPERG